MKSYLSVAAALAVCAGVAHAQTVEYRIIERKGRTVVTGPADSQLDFAVQARAFGAANIGLSGFSFNIHIVGELEASGVLERGFINNSDHTLSSAIGVSNSVGQGGVAYQYSFLAALNSGFNGVINAAASAAFTNGPDQEIAIVTGSVDGAPFLQTPGIDLNSDGNPDTWGSGTGAVPFVPTFAPISPAILQEYFGAGGNWVDVYRFRYTLTSFAPRTLDVRLEQLAGSTFTSAMFVNSLWGPASSHTVTPTASNLLIGVATPVAGACCSIGTCAITMPADCSGIFLGSGACSPNACSTPPSTLSSLACCVGINCFVTYANNCVGSTRASSTCSPTVCAQSVGGRLCCDANGQCTVGGSCATPYYGVSTCTPNPCPIPIASGACCRTSTGLCVPTLAGQCAGIYMSNTACFPSPCTATPGTCCDTGTGLCTFVTHNACPDYFLAVGTCSPNPCPPPRTNGACCELGTCTLTAPTACTGIFSGASVCGTSTCQANAACCDWTTGTCVVILSTACVGPLPVRPTCSPTPCPPPPIAAQFRIIERTGRSLVTGPANAQLDLAIQARIVSAAASVGLAKFSFDMRILGESESSGSLARALTSNPDHTYSAAFATSNTIGQGGLASQFSALAASNANFNGLINSSAGTFVNGPDQEIGLISGQSSGNPFITTPGIDNDTDGNPDSWPGSGSLASPPNGTRAVLSPAASPTYFGAASHWVDIYRFRYNVTSFTSRSLIFHLNNPQADAFSQVFYTVSGSVWSPWLAHPTSSASDLIIGVIDAVPGACCSSAGTCTLIPRASCTGTFLAAPTCTPNPCSTPIATGACCGLGGVCILITADACEGNFIGASACEPSPCPPPGLAVVCCIGACCQNRACTVSTQSGCPASGGYSFKGLGSVCTSDPDPAPCCPANFNGFGGVNVQDLYAFLIVWFAADPAADFDASGTVSTVDVLEFLRTWVSGC